MSSDSSVRSVERAIDVLFSFTQQERFSIPALQQRTGLSRPTLYRLLRTHWKAGADLLVRQPATATGRPHRLAREHVDACPPLVTLAASPGAAAWRNQEIIARDAVSGAPGISNSLVCEKPGKPDSALGGQPMPAWMAGTGAWAVALSGFGRPDGSPLALVGP